MKDETPTNKPTEKKVKASDPVVEKFERLRRSREQSGRPARDELVSSGPLKIDETYYGITKADRVRWVHLENPGRMEKFAKLGYDTVKDPISGDPVVKEVRIGAEVRKSYLMKTDETLYQKGQKLKSDRVKDGVRGIEENAKKESLNILESNLDKLT